MPYSHISILVDVSYDGTGIIAQYEERTAKLKADVPQLEAIISKTWGKEDKLKQLKSELAALDRKITAELAPKHDENDGTENKQEQSQQSQSEVKDNTIPSQKTSMVAEPPGDYKHREPLSFRIFIGGCAATTPGGFFTGEKRQADNRTRPKL